MLRVAALRVAAREIVTPYISTVAFAHTQRCAGKRRQDKFILQYISTVNGFCQFCNEF